MIWSSAKLLLCHTQDMLDNHLLSKNLFVLDSQLGKVKRSAAEMIDLIKDQANLKKIKIIYDEMPSVSK